MKKILILILIFFCAFYFKKILFNKNLNQQKEEKTIIPTEKAITKTPTPEIKNEIILKKSIFIPSWQLNQIDQYNNLNQYERLIYFGEEGYLDEFVTKLTGEDKNQALWFAYKINEIPQPSQWDNIVSEKISLLKKYKFEGIVLDLEVSGLPSEKLILEINNFVDYFSGKIKEAGFKNALAIYGDTFYRKRPYDVNFFSQVVDEIMIMAYDFSKSYGEPGPNFPFQGGQKYGYDFKTMIDDFLKVVSKDKLTVIFGFFGYDWQVDERKRPISPAKALTLNQIKEKFLSFGVTSTPRSDKNVTFLENLVNEVKNEEIINCKLENCLIRRDSLSQEVEINYVISSPKPDEMGIYRLLYHIVWFEDDKSAQIKSNYLKERGIEKVGYWAIDYF
jgi:hypothetical protein